MENINRNLSNGNLNNEKLTNKKLLMEMKVIIDFILI